MKILQNYKNKQCKTWLGKYFQLLTFTWMYKIYTAIALILIGSISFNFTQEGTFMETFVSGLYSIGFLTFILLAIIMFGAMIFYGIKAFANWLKKKK